MKVGEEYSLELAAMLMARCGKHALRASLGMRLGFPQRMIRRKCKPVEVAGRPLSWDLPFFGGVLEIDGGRAIAHPLTSRTGRQVASIILSTMLKGIYAGDYRSQGDLIWKSLQLRMDRANEILKELDLEDEELALESSIRSTKLWPFLAITMTPDVTEAYAHFNGPLYLDHVELGRIVVENYLMDREEVSKLMTFVEADVNAGIDFSSPLNEVDLTLGEHHFRMALDFPPASMGAVDVRNLSAMSRLSLPRLISLRSLTGYEAALMIDSLARGDPVLIFGRTGVGKTTLSNALLASLPRHWRIVSVEEVREIEDLTRYGMHHTPYEITSGKLDFIKFLLHRNPDLVFLGEILGREHAEAFDLTSFSGLKVVATTHARDYRGFIQKWSSWGVRLPEGTLAVRMEEKRVVEMRRWVDEGWDDPGSPSAEWLMHVKRLEGAETNEEVHRRIRGLPEEG